MLVIDCSHRFKKWYSQDLKLIKLTACCKNDIMDEAAQFGTWLFLILHKLCLFNNVKLKK